jgi:hypothetical protein
MNRRYPPLPEPIKRSNSIQPTVNESRYGGQECKNGGGQERQGVSRDIEYARAVRHKYHSSCPRGE